MRRFFVCLTTVILLCAVVVSVTVSSAFAASPNYDYSLPGSVGNESIGASDFLEDVLGFDITEEEKEYLNLYSDFSLSHISTVPIKYVTLEYIQEDRKLKCVAREYTYVAGNGVRVTWIPTTAICRGGRVELNKVSGEYIGGFSDIEVSDDNSVSVEYRADFEISKDVINSFLNLAYKDAPRLKTEIEEKTAEYNAKKAQYDIDKAKYDEYLVAKSEYDSLYAVYKNYLTAKKIYDEKNAAYLKYLSDLAEYENDKKAYDEYCVKLEQYNKDLAKYQDYLDFLKEYEYEIKAYEAYEKKINTVRAQLAIIEWTKVPATSLKRTVYDAIMGSTVTSVLENKDLLTGEIGGNVDGAAIDLAGESTEKLRILMTDYFSCDTESAKYAYYISHYQEFLVNFTGLLRSLDALYGMGRVAGILRSEEKEVKYLILVSQLYYIVNALSDVPVSNYYKNSYYDSKYKIGEYPYNKTPYNHLSGTVLNDTDNAKPLEDGYPAEVAKPEYTVVPEPIKPEKVNEPTKPTEVASPGEAPSVVYEPTKPAEVSNPGDEPVPYVPPQGAEGIISLCDRGLLSEREEHTADYTVSRTVSLTRKFIGEEIFSVVYYDIDGTVLYITDIENGSVVEYGGAVPTKDEDASATYTFECWVDADGEDVDLTNVTKDLSLYPKFRPTYKKYDITWVIEEENYTESVTWGEIPVCPVEPTKPDSITKYYTFSSWDKDVKPVSGDETYTAVFDESFIVPSSDGGSGAEVFADEDRITVKCQGSGSELFDISRVLDMTEGELGVTLHTLTGSAKFSISETRRLSEENVKYVSVFSVNRGNKGYSYTLKLHDENGEILDTGIESELSVVCDISAHEGLSLYYIEEPHSRSSSEEVRQKVRYTAVDNAITFKAVAGVTYYATVEYDVMLVSSSLVGISVNKLTANPGDRISVSVSVPIGIELDGLYYIDSMGEKHYLESRYFSMPESDIYICAEAHYIRYTVKFVSEEKIISMAEYKYGEMPKIPDAPKKAADSIYSYEFVGWSSEVGNVTSDVTYTAVFSEKLLPETPKNNPGLSPKVEKLLILGYSGLTIFFCGVLPVSVMSISMFFVRKKRIKIPKKLTRGGINTKK